MGTGERTSAISLGVLALAIGGGSSLLASAPAHATTGSATHSTTAQVRDCDMGGGLLRDIGGRLCEIVEKVKKVGDRPVPTPETEPLAERTAETVRERTRADPVPVPVPDVTPSAPVEDPSEPRESGLRVEDTLREVCLPLLASCTEEGPEESAPAAPPPGGAPSRPAPSPEPVQVVPAEPVRPAERRPVLPAPGDGSPGMPDATSRATTSPAGEVPVPPLLWPWGDVAEVRPGRAAPGGPGPAEPTGTMGNALTATLLLSAVLAARLVSIRRARAARPPSMPFEPARTHNGGRHRLA